MEKVKPRILPQSLEAEQAVLGCLLIDKECAPAIFGEIDRDDFYSESNAIIFGAMKDLYLKNSPIDYVTLSDVILTNNLVDKTGGLEYISSLTTVLPSAANFKNYANIVKTKSVLRKLIKAGQTIVNTGFESQDLTEAIASAEKNVFDLSKEQDISSLTEIGITLNDVIAKFDKVFRDPESLKGLKTGFTKLDEITNGLQKSDLILLAARPGVGKTSFAMNIVSNVALNGGKVAVFSLEMPKIQIAQRTLCSIANVSMKKAVQGKLNKDEWDAIIQAKKKLAETKIFVDDSSLNTPVEILSKCRRLQRENGLDLIMIDYLQLMTSGSKSKDANRQQEVSEMSRSLKILARELNVPVILLSQLSRAVESRQNHRPQLSDLRESGAIEQDADIVLFIYKPEMYNDVEIKDGEQDICELIIAKHRNGELDTVKLKWVGEITSFKNLDYEAKPGVNTHSKKLSENQLSDNDAPPEFESVNFDDIL